jgi:hypothetical protein
VFKQAEIDWGELRSEACAVFGQPPGEQLEERIVKEFPAHPQLVAASVHKIIRAFKEGRVYAPWPVLAKDVEREARRADHAHELVAVPQDEPKQIRQTKTLIRNRIYIEEELDVARDEIEAALGPFAGDRFLVDEMLELWRERRLQVGWGC